MYLVEIMLLININFIVTWGEKVDITTKKDRGKTTITTKENNYSIAIKENNKNNNKMGITISTNSKLTNLTKL